MICLELMIDEVICVLISVSKTKLSIKEAAYKWKTVLYNIKVIKPKNIKMQTRILFISLHMHIQCIIRLIQK